jgi:isopenicillin N synthase-like dioxygenase
MTATPENAALPIVDFSRLVLYRTSAGDAAAQTSAQERSNLFAALRDIGFVYLQHHSIPQSSEAALFSHARRFFALPECEKAKVETGPTKFFHGWFSPQRTSQAAAHSDQKEAFDIGDDSNASRPNQWPAGWPEFRADMADFFDRCHALHLDLLGALAIEVGMPRDFFVPYVLAKDHFFRVLYYPETTGESFKNRLRANTHTDYGTLTLLFNDNSGGLQVRNKAGQFVDAPPIPGAIIVNGKSTSTSPSP